jgi:hypothetical protein
MKGITFVEVVIFTLAVGVALYAVLSAQGCTTITANTPEGNYTYSTVLRSIEGVSIAKGNTTITLTKAKSEAAQTIDSVASLVNAVAAK